MKKNLLFICLLFVCIFGFTSCELISGTKDNITNNITNEITNNITNEIVTETHEIKLNYTIEDLQTALNTAIKKVQDSVIGVSLKKVSTIGGSTSTFEDKNSVGSGVVYKRVENYEDEVLKSYTYYVITNCHVITGDYKDVEYKVYAFLGNEQIEYPATVLGKNSKLDLACITFESGIYLPIVEFSTEELSKGDFVFAIGNPDGYDYYNSATFGIISNLGRFISFDTDDDGTDDFVGTFIQTDAAINPGNSGGGLFTLDGKLIGINSVKLASSEIDNMGFAIPVNIVDIAINEYLEKGEEIKFPRMGITTIALRDFNSNTMAKLGLTALPAIYGDEAPYGLYIDSVSSGSTCDGEISSGDIILKIDGVKIFYTSDISGRLNDLATYGIGQEIEITFYNHATEEVVTKNIILKGVY